MGVTMDSYVTVLYFSIKINQFSKDPKPKSNKKITSSKPESNQLPKSHRNRGYTPQHLAKGNEIREKTKARKNLTKSFHELSILLNHIIVSLFNLFIINIKLPLSYFLLLVMVEGPMEVYISWFFLSKLGAEDILELTRRAFCMVIFSFTLFRPSALLYITSFLISTSPLRFPFNSSYLFLDGQSLTHARFS